MSTSHRALIVEDHPPTAEDLAEILRSMDCDPSIVATRDAALRFLESERPCVVLLDLSIPRSTDHIKGRAAVGISLLREIRRQFGSPRLQAVWLPIIVVSAHANEVDEAVELMKLEADDIIRKPYKEREIVRKVGDALRKSGREHHHACAALVTSPKIGPVLEIPGRSIKRRTIVCLGGRDLQLPDSELFVLLHLLLGRATGRRVPLEKLGNDQQVAYKRLAHLRKTLAGAVENPTSIIVNDAGTYMLSERIEIGVVNTSWLADRGNAEIARVIEALKSAAK